MKFIVKLLLVTLLALITIVLGSIIWINSQQAQNVIEKNLSQFLEDKLGLSVKIRNLRIGLPLIAEAELLTLYDKDGEIGYIKNLQLSLNPSPFIFSQFIINSISAEEIDIKKTNVKIKEIEQKTNVSNSFTPNITIQQINIDRLILETGSYNISASLAYEPQAQLINFKLLGKSLSSHIDFLQENELQISGSYNNQQLILGDIDFKSPWANIKGNLSLDQEATSVNGELSYNSTIIEEFTKDVLPHIQSNITGHAKIKGTLAKPKIDTNGNIEISLANDVEIRFLPLSFNAEFLFDKEEFVSNFNLTQGRLRAYGLLNYTGDKLHLQKFIASGTHFENEIDLSLDVKTMLLNGKLAISDKTLSITAQYFPFIQSGNLNLNAIFTSSSDKKQHILINTSAKNLQLGGGSVEGISVKLESDDLWQGSIANLDLLLKALNTKDISIEKLKIAAKPKERGRDKEIVINGSLLSHTPLSTNLYFETILQNKQKEEINLQLSKISGQIGKTKISKKSSMILKHTSNITEIMADIIADSGGKLHMQADIQKSFVLAKAVIQQLPAGMFIDFLSSPFENATINGEIGLTGQNANPLIKSVINISGIREVKTKEVLAMNLNSLITKNTTDISIGISNDHKQLSVFKANFKNNFSFSPFSYSVQKDEPFNASLTLGKNVNFLSLIPDIADHKISGVLEGSVNASGTLNNYHLAGQLNLIGGKYAYQNQLIKLKDISGIIKAQDKHISFSNILAKDNYGNNLRCNGLLNLTGTGDFKFNLVTNKFSPINIPYADGVLSGQIDISGNSAGALAKGQLLLGPLEIKIPERFTQNIPELNIVQVVDEQAIKKEQDKKAYLLNLDIDARTGDQVFVKGWGVDAKLQGKIDVKGTIDKPLIFGKLTTVRGQYQEFGKLLNIREGVLTFDGPIIPSPYLRILGITNTSGYEIRLRLIGPILEPELFIESTPALPQEKALSILLFGKNSENLSAFQGLQLADSARRLSGKGSLNPLGLGKKILRVDNINFKTDENNPEKNLIGVGKYLTDKIYLEVEQGWREKGVKTRVEVQLTPKISLENVTQQDGATSFGVNWKFDY